MLKEVKKWLGCRPQMVILDDPEEERPGDKELLKKLRREYRDRKGENSPRRNKSPILDIFLLLDPESITPRYVGYSDDAETAVEQLSKDSRTKVCLWIAELRKRDLRPLVQLLESVSNVDVARRTQWWIKQYEMVPGFLQVSKGSWNRGLRRT